jgi:ribonuclease HI
MININVFTDGGSRGNPGKSACAFVVYDFGNIIHQEKVFLGINTNNQAEYNGLLFALRYINERGVRDQEFKFFSDSELMVKQINGIYKVKDSGILKIFTDVKKEISKIPNFSIKHIRREENALADKLVNKCLDEN